MKFSSIRTAALSALAAAGLLAAASPAPALEVRAAARQLTRKVAYTAVPAASIVRAASGRVVEGKVTFSSSLGGSPTGTATQACARVKVSATKFVPGTGDSFGYDQLVKQVSATPVDAGDVSKGCKYSLSALPHSIQLSIDAHYEPTTAWSPTCEGNISQIGTSKVMTLTLPNANVKVTLDQLIDYKYCGWLN